MTRVYIKNDSLNEHTNEIKMAVSPRGSCDPNLDHLGDFSLSPGERQFVVEVDQTTDFYYKNIREAYWNHGVAWHFEEEKVFSASTTTRVPEDQRIDICDSQFKNMISAGDIPNLLLEESIFLSDAPIKGMIDGFANWEYAELFCRIVRTGAEHGYVAYLPTFNIDERPDGKHFEVIAVKMNAGDMTIDQNKNIFDYGAVKSCSLLMCFIKCPSVQDYFRYTATNHVTGDSRYAGAIPTFCFHGNRDEIPRPVVVFTKRGPTEHTVFRAEDIGSPDPNGDPAEIIRIISDRSKAYSHIVAAYPDFHHAFDPRPGIGRVFGVTVFFQGSAELIWLPESEIR